MESLHPLSSNFNDIIFLRARLALISGAEIKKIIYDSNNYLFSSHV
jgi:hypothetical protein